MNKSKFIYEFFSYSPRNPENHNSLWIGNVQPDVTEKKISTLFSK